MPRQVKTTPRKRPRQDRSRATVDAVLAATARILVKRGYLGLTTNAVAELAGISIGSLYQYFPNKEALVSALIERHTEQVQGAILSELKRAQQLPMAQVIRAVVGLALEAHAIDPELHRVLTEQMPNAGRLAKLRELDAITQRIVAGILAARRDEIAIRDPDLAAFILVSTIEGIAHSAILFGPERLRDPRLLDETCALVERYLLT